MGLPAIQRIDVTRSAVLVNRAASYGISLRPITLGQRHRVHISNSTVQLLGPDLGHPGGH